MTDSVLQRLQQRLNQAAVPFELIHHQPVYTSQQAAAVRGTSLASGAKALVCKADEAFLLFVLPADRKLASKNLRKLHGWKSLRFANPDEVRQITTLQPGAIPPFGSLFGLATWCDRRLAGEPAINFNAGDHSVSISMTFDDFVRLETPRIAELADDSPATSDPNSPQSRRP